MEDLPGRDAGSRRRVPPAFTAHDVGKLSKPFGRAGPSPGQGSGPTIVLGLVAIGTAENHLGPFIPA